MLKRAAHTGFTIIELAVALAIFGLLFATALPSLELWIANSKIRSVSEHIQNGIQQARAEAVRRNKPMSFWLVSSDEQGNLSDNCTLSNSSGSWVISEMSPEGQCASAPSSTDSPKLVTARGAGNASGSVLINAVQSDGTTAANSLTFTPFGRITSLTGIAQIDVTGFGAATEYRSLRILINSTGMVRMCDPRVTNADDPRICPTAS